MDLKWYVIYSGDYNFTVLKTVYTTFEAAWEGAHRIAKNLTGVIKHYDVLGGFNTELEMQKAIIEYCNLEDNLKEVNI